MKSFPNEAANSEHNVVSRVGHDERPLWMHIPRKQRLDTARLMIECVNGLLVTRRIGDTVHISEIVNPKRTWERDFREAALMHYQQLEADEYI